MQSHTSFDGIKDEISQIYSQKVATQENMRYKQEVLKAGHPNKNYLNKNKETLINILD